MISVFLFDVVFMQGEGQVHLVSLIEQGDVVSESLVEKVGDLSVLIDLFVSVEIGFEQVEVAVRELLKSRLHGSSKGSIGVFEIALALVGGLGTRCFVHLCTSTSTGRGFSSGSSCSGSPTGTTSASAATSFGRAGLLRSSVCHGGGAIQICVGRCSGKGVKGLKKKAGVQWAGRKVRPGNGERERCERV